MVLGDERVIQDQGVVGRAPDEVTRKDLSVWREVGKAPEPAELDEGGAWRPGGAT